MPDPANTSPATAERRGARLGMILFLLYTACYLGFVLINAFSPESMDRIVMAGLNLAIVYGFGLILLAILLAFVYGFSRRREGTAESTGSQKGGQP